ncbi:MAG: hypothetical protein Q8K17_04375, partial [Pseudohongiella sp.]|nr:hypothetical protein [Pseudohongiella sp.]
MARERDVYGWLKLPLEVTTPPLVSGEEMLAWLGICGRYSAAQIAESKLKFPASSALVDPQTFASAVANESAAIMSLDQLQELRKHRAYAAIYAMPTGRRIELGQILRNLEEHRAAVSRISSSWSKDALRDLIAGKRGRWDTILDRTHELLVDAENLSSKIGHSVVTTPANQDRRKVRVDAQAAMTFLNEGGSWKRLGMFIPAELKGKTYLKDEVLVDGVGAASPEQLQTVINEISLGFVFDELISIWKMLGVVVSSENRRLLLADFQEQQADLKHCTAYADDCLKASRFMSMSSPVVPEPDWLNGEIAQWTELLDVAEKEDIYQSARDAVKRCTVAVGSLAGLHNAHMLVTKIATSLEQRNIGDYSRYYADLVALEEICSLQLQRVDIENRLKVHVPYLVPDIAGSLDNANWHQRLSSWEEAWLWAIADNWLEKRTDFSYQQKLWRRRHDVDTVIGRLVAESAALRAWTHFFKRLSPRESAALKSWREAVKAMGKGTGKSARMARLRQEARQYMDACRDAIPI